MRVRIPARLVRKMGVDIHEKRRVNGQSDRNPNSPYSRDGVGSYRGKGLGKAPRWVQEKAREAAHRRHEKEALYSRRYLGG